MCADSKQIANFVAEKNNIINEKTYEDWTH